MSRDNARQIFEAKMQTIMARFARDEKAQAEKENAERQKAADDMAKLNIQATLLNMGKDFREGIVSHMREIEFAPDAPGPRGIPVKQRKWDYKKDPGADRGWLPEGFLPGGKAPKLGKVGGAVKDYLLPLEKTEEYKEFKALEETGVDPKSLTGWINPETGEQGTAQEYARLVEKRQLSWQADEFESIPLTMEEMKLQEQRGYQARYEDWQKETYIADPDPVKPEKPIVPLETEDEFFDEDIEVTEYTGGFTEFGDWEIAPPTAEVVALQKEATALATEGLNIPDISIRRDAQNVPSFLDEIEFIGGPLWKSKGLRVDLNNVKAELEDLKAILMETPSGKEDPEIRKRYDELIHKHNNEILPKIKAAQDEEGEALMRELYEGSGRETTLQKSERLILEEDTQKAMEMYPELDEKSALDKYYSYGDVEGIVSTGAETIEDIAELEGGVPEVPITVPDVEVPGVTPDVEVPGVTPGVEIPDAKSNVVGKLLEHGQTALQLKNIGTTIADRNATDEDRGVASVQGLKLLTDLATERAGQQTVSQIGGAAALQFGKVAREEGLKKGFKSLGKEGVKLTGKQTVGAVLGGVLGAHTMVTEAKEAGESWEEKDYDEAILHGVASGSGALQTGGATMMATGIGAPLGAVLYGIGTVGSLLSGAGLLVEGLFGKEEEAPKPKFDASRYFKPAIRESRYY